MKNNIYKILIFCVTLNSICNIAICDTTDPYFIKKDERAQYDGWLFTEGKTKEIRNKLIDLDTQLKLNESYQTIITLSKDQNKIQEDKISLLLDQNDKLSRSLYDERSMTTWERLFWFGLGVLGTVFATYGVKKAIE